MMEALKEILPQLLVAILIPIAGAVGVLVAVLLKKAISRINNEALQGAAWLAVRFVEQKFTKLHGQDKFDKAYERLAGKIKGVNKDDIEQAIEAAVSAMNEHLGNVDGSAPGQ